MSKSSGRDKWLQVRMTVAEREEVNRLAAEAGLRTSEFVRKAVAYIKATRPTMEVYPIVPGEPPVGDKERWLQVRVSDAEKQLVHEVAELYDVDDSRLIRTVLGYFRVTRPRLNIRPEQQPLRPKGGN